MIFCWKVRFSSVKHCRQTPFVSWQVLQDSLCNQQLEPHPSLSHPVNKTLPAHLQPAGTPTAEYDSYLCTQTNYTTAHCRTFQGL